MVRVQWQSMGCYGSIEGNEGISDINSQVVFMDISSCVKWSPRLLESGTASFRSQANVLLYPGTVDPDKAVLYMIFIRLGPVKVSILQN